MILTWYYGYLLYYLYHVYRRQVFWRVWIRVHVHVRHCSSFPVVLHSSYVLQWKSRIKKVEMLKRCSFINTFVQETQYKRFTIDKRLDAEHSMTWSNQPNVIVIIYTFRKHIRTHVNNSWSFMLSLPYIYKNNIYYLKDTFTWDYNRCMRIWHHEHIWRKACTR